MKRISMAVLRVSAKEFSRLYTLAGHVITQMTANLVLFPQPDPALALFTTENNKLDVAIKAKDGSKQKNQACEAQAVVVFNMLKSQVAYVNKIAKGDRNTILLSGFDASNEPTPKQVPGIAVIKRIEDGKSPHSAKIYIEPLAGAEHYKVETSITPEDAASWKTVLDLGSLKTLEVTGLVYAQETWFRVTGGNNHGWGKPSDIFCFLPR